MALACVRLTWLPMFSDGKKMSKSLKNYPDPSLILDRYGADATRFVYYCSFAWVICLRQHCHRQDVSRELTYSPWRQSTIPRRGRTRGYLAGAPSLAQFFPILPRSGRTSQEGSG